MVRPFPLLAVILTAIALAFYIAAAASADWLESLQANTQIYEGPYNVCWRQHDAGIRECRHVNNDCTASISDPVSDFTVTQRCDSWRAVRAFLVLAIITSALALLAIYLASFSKLPFLPLRAPALLLSFIAGVFGLIAWAIFLSISRDNTAYTVNTVYVSSRIGNWQYGFGFGLLTAAWVLNWVSLPLAAMPFPFLPSAYDRTRFLPSTAAYGEGEEAERQREADRQRALSEGGMAAGLWRLFGVTPEKRRGYAERWGGAGGSRGGESVEEAQRRREGGGAEREEREPAERRLPVYHPGTVSSLHETSAPSLLSSAFTRPATTSATSSSGSGGGAGTEVPVHVHGSQQSQRLA